MARLAAIVLLAGGCAAHVQNVEDNPLFAAAWSGPPPHVGLQVTGPAASADTQARCAATVARAGGVVDARAGVQALVTLDERGNRLQIVSARRGMLKDEPRPGWTLERLCDDALLEAAVALRQEQPATVPMTVGAPPPPDGAFSTTAPHGPDGAEPAGPAPTPTQSGPTQSGPIR